jgi:hypothetical protein
MQGVSILREKEGKISSERLLFVVERWPCLKGGGAVCQWLHTWLCPLVRLSVMLILFITKETVIEIKPSGSDFLWFWEGLHRSLF